MGIIIQFERRVHKVKICCGVCHVQLNNADVVTLDFFNTLHHYACLGADVDLITEIATYKNIKEKYWFFQDKMIH